MLPSCGGIEPVSWFWNSSLHMRAMLKRARDAGRGAVRGLSARGQASRKSVRPRCSCDMSRRRRAKLRTVP